MFLTHQTTLVFINSPKTTIQIKNDGKFGLLLCEQSGRNGLQQQTPDSARSTFGVRILSPFITIPGQTFVNCPMLKKDAVPTIHKIASAPSSAKRSQNSQSSQTPRQKRSVSVEFMIICKNALYTLTPPRWSKLIYRYFTLHRLYEKH